MIEPTTDGLTVGLTIFATLAGLTAYGIYLGFGPPKNELEDPFEHHDD